MIPFPDKKYQIIYADPPWNFNFKNRKGLSITAKEALYETMKPQDVLALPVCDITEDNCVLFLWIMNSQIQLGLDVIKSWAFTYKTVAFTWVKLAKLKYHFGGGNWTRSNPEQCLLATKGNVKRISASVRQLVVEPRREHSRKPDRIREDIVELVGDLSRIELFARERTEGWDVWGDEV
jgi:N6-adenosine-specific RNA methylase IME4